MVYPNCDPVPEIEIGSLQCQLDTHSELNNGHVPSPKYEWTNVDDLERTSKTITWESTWKFIKTIMDTM